MSDTNAVVVAAQRLSTKDESALAVEIGLRQKLLESDPGTADNPNIVVVYGTHMGLIGDVKALGCRILTRWNKELYGVVCTRDKADDVEIKTNILQALSFDEAALISAVAPALVCLGAPAAIAAPVAALVVKKFILPAKEELCEAWGEAIIGES